MANTLAQFAKLLKPIGGKPDMVVAIKIHPRAISLVELRFAGNRIDVITLHSVGNKVEEMIILMAPTVIEPEIGKQSPNSALSRTLGTRPVQLNEGE